MTEPTEPLSGGRYVRSSESGEYVREPVEQPAASGDAASEASTDETPSTGKKGK